jgi:hypothetical protein
MILLMMRPSPLESRELRCGGLSLGYGPAVFAAPSPLCQPSRAAARVAQAFKAHLADYHLPSDVIDGGL